MTGTASLTPDAAAHARSSARPCARSSRPDRTSASTEARSPRGGLEGRAAARGLGRAGARRASTATTAPAPIWSSTAGRRLPSASARRRRSRRPGLPVQQPGADGRRVAQAGAHHDGDPVRRPPTRSSANRWPTAGRCGRPGPTPPATPARATARRGRDPSATSTAIAISTARRALERPRCRVHRRSARGRHVHRRREAQDVDQDDGAHVCHPAPRSPPGPSRDGRRTPTGSPAPARARSPQGLLPPEAGERVVVVGLAPRRSPPGGTGGACAPASAPCRAAPWS